MSSAIIVGSQAPEFGPDKKMRQTSETKYFGHRAIWMFHNELQDNISKYSVLEKVSV